MILMPITGWSLSDPSQSRHNCSGSSPGNKMILSIVPSIDYPTAIIRMSDRSLPVSSSIVFHNPTGLAANAAEVK